MRLWLDEPKASLVVLSGVALWATWRLAFVYDVWLPLVLVVPLVVFFVGEALTRTHRRARRNRRMLRGWQRAGRR